MENLKREILELLEKDLEFRYAIAGYLGLSEILKRLDGLAEEQTRLAKEQVNLRREQTRLAEEQTRLAEEQARLAEEQANLRREQTRLAEEQTRLAKEQARLAEEQIRLREEIIKIWEEIHALRGEQAKTWAEIARIWEEIGRLRADMTEGFNLLRRHIDALGARWGMLSERAFREGLRALVEREFGFRVEKWTRYDERGFVYGYPSHIDIDVAIHDERAILIEIKSHVNREDIYNFKRKTEFYRISEGKVPARLVIVTPYADEEAQEEARKLGIEIYSRV